MRGNYYLFRCNEMVGEAIVFPSGRVMYHLYKSSYSSFESTIDYMNRKYKMVKKVAEA